ncbi:MAG TPA: MBL fold metallo-hydrolase [Pyrinomonadaceae bacterium]|jgi:glyoxylase-like metal-dependent hydrolase (beta-lactamase superfamily II)/8-oxo-dGTP pyrophosphatase MutT (NUDIX family)|nr:MBL fold metallo-hydrolase [Pyrinomonadaceae bacterium]
MPSTIGPTPKDAAAIVLLRHNTDPSDPEVFLVKRSDKLAFLGGFHAFPGGQFDPQDAEAPVDNASDAELATAISCAARELFEETQVLVARGGEALTQGQRASLLDDLQTRRMSWPALLKHYQLHLDANDFTFVGRWVTPPFSARRFDTWFFLVNCPAKQRAHIDNDGELESGDWVPAGEAHARWERSEILAVPPVLHALKTLSGGLTDDLVERFLASPNVRREPVRRIEFRPNYICFPVRTPTKPPATHTNCYLIYTSQSLLVVDPGSPYEEEQRALAKAVDELLAQGRTLKSILLTHVHPDHVGGVNALRSHLGDVSVAAHKLTADALRDINVDKLLDDEDVLELEGEPPIALQVLHTPGHARGHLCLYEERTGTLLSGDNIVGLGSVLIDPPEGNMRDYLRSLERMRALGNLSVIFGGHGPAIANPYRKLDEYISHRLDREQKILAAVCAGAATAKAIVAQVYTDVHPKAHAMAERAVLAHLEKLEADGLVSQHLNSDYVAPG